MKVLVPLMSLEKGSKEATNRKRDSAILTPEPNATHMLTLAIKRKNMPLRNLRSGRKKPSTNMILLPAVLPGSERGAEINEKHLYLITIKGFLHVQGEAGQGKVRVGRHIYRF